MSEKRTSRSADAATRPFAQAHAVSRAPYRRRAPRTGQKCSQKGREWKRSTGRLCLRLCSRRLCSSPSLRSLLARAASLHTQIHASRSMKKFQNNDISFDMIILIIGSDCGPTHSDVYMLSANDWCIGCQISFVMDIKRISISLAL